MSDCYTFKQRRARKEHICVECKGVIKKDEQYTYHSGVWEGIGQDFKVCCDCQELRDTITEGLFHDEVLVFGGLSDSFDDMNDPTISKAHDKFLETMYKRNKKFHDEMTWIYCWCCNKMMTLKERSLNDGFCPKCHAEIELD